MPGPQKEEILKTVEKIKAQGYESICFWMPCYNVSGGAKYLRDLAVQIADNTDLKIYYMDFEEGFPSSLLVDNKNVTILKYNPDDENFPLEEPTIIFTNSTKVIQMQKMNRKSKMLFWHFETIPCAWNLLFFNKEEEAFMKLAKETKAMVYHDWSGRDILNTQFDVNFDNKDYLQVYGSEYTGEMKRKEFNDREINVVWLSRLGTDKICSLLNIIDNFAKLQTDRIKRLHIIGDGIRRDVVEQYAKKFKERLEIIFTGTLQREDLTDYMLLNADVVFAMGTSVVDAAALKIPSVVVQLSTKPFKDDAFYWLFDAKEYCVGITTDEKKRYKVPYKKFETLIKEIDSAEKTNMIGEKCYEYFRNNHYDFQTIVEKFLKYCEQTQLTYKKLKKAIRFTPYSMVEQVSYHIRKITLYSRVKFGNRLYITRLGVPSINYLLDGSGRVIKWGLFKWRPIMPKIIKKKYILPDNESSSKKLIKIGDSTLMNIEKNKSQTRYVFMNKKNIMTKRENIGYKFPQSLFKG